MPPIFTLVAVIGAGPAGLAASHALASESLDTVSDVGYVLTVEQENLANAQQIGAAKIRMTVKPDWVDRAGRDNVVVSRRTDGQDGLSARPRPPLYLIPYGTLRC